MQYRFLGNSGFKVSAISYGNWLTHGSQIEADQAIKTVHAAYENGITTFDTADVYAGTKAEVVLADAIKGFVAKVLSCSQKFIGRLVKVLMIVVCHASMSWKPLMGRYDV